jgi:hypothetical protein
MRVGCVAERAADDKLTVVSIVMAGLVPAIYVKSGHDDLAEHLARYARFGYG